MGHGMQYRQQTIQSTHVLAHIVLRVDIVLVIMRCAYRGKASVNSRRPVTGDTALHLAAARAHAEMVGLLLCHGADSALTNAIGETALFHAVRSGVADTTR